MTVLTCDKCDTQFEVSEAALAGGRKVRCTTCLHVWYQPDPNAVDDEPESLEDRLQSFSDVLDEQDDGARSSVPEAMQPEDDASTGIEIADEKPKKKMSAQTAIVLFAGTFLLALIGILVVQQTMVAKFPQTSGLYEAMGIEGEPAWTGMKIQEGIAIIRPMKNGEMLYIEATVINLSDNAKRVPPVRVDLTDKDTGEVLQTWNPDVAKVNLEPGEKYEVKLGFTDVQYKLGDVKIYFRPFD